MSWLAENPWLEPLFALIAASVAFLPKPALRPTSLVWFGLLIALWFAGVRSPWFLIPAITVVPLVVFTKTTTWNFNPLKYVTLLGGIAGAGLSWLFPLPALPQPSGPYPVGTRTIELPAEQDAGPKLVIQIWYPSIPSDSLARWLPDPELARRFPLRRQKDAASRAASDSPVASAERLFPVLFYEHAWNGHRAENVAQTEDLASRGFVVVAIDHPGQAARIRYMDGSVARSVIPPTPDFSSEAAVAGFEREAERLLEIREANILRVKSVLSSTEASGDIASACRWDKVGIFGFSFGGSCAIRLCEKNRDFIAGANEDGLYLHNGVPAGPFLFLDQAFPAWLQTDPAPTETPEQKLVRRAESKLKVALSNPEASRIVLAETRHACFTDRKFLSRLSFLKSCGPRPAADIHREITSAVGGFFERTLKPPAPGTSGRK